MIETLTFDRALQLLWQVAAERPDYIYSSPDLDSCVYIDRTDGKPSCLIGHVLLRAGWTIEELRRHNQTDVKTLFARFERPIDADALALLDEAQLLQDDGDYTWAEAVERAHAICTGQITEETS